EIERGRFYPDKVLRAVRDRPVNAEDRQLDLLTGLSITSEDHTVGGIEAFDYLSARLPQNSRHFAVHPDFGVIINHNFKCDRRSRRAYNPYFLRNCDVDPIPIEADLRRRAALVEGRGINRFPLRVIELSNPGSRLVVVGLGRCATRLQVWTY